MKGIKFITTFLILVILGIFVCHANVGCYNWTDNFVKAFEETDAKFKCYNIKVNGTIYNKSPKEIKKLNRKIVECFSINKCNTKLNIEEKKNELKSYIEVKDNTYSISFQSIQKNKKEYYIIVDISSNKVYKNIVDIYQNLNKLLNNYLEDVEISTCIIGEYTKNLQFYKYNDILKNILYNMSAKKIDKIETDNYISITAYSKLLKENDLEYLEDKINLNIGIRYSEKENKTLVYIATPIIKLDY